MLDPAAQPGAFVAAWVRRLRAVSEPTLAATPIVAAMPGRDDRPAAPSRERFIAEFRDGSGDRRAVDRPLLSAMLGVPAGPLPGPDACRADTIAWWALHDGTARDRLPIDWSARGRLFPSLAEDAIEVWTEAEMSALHALCWLGLRSRDERMLARAFACAEWLIDEVQPDNATQRPWASHPFVVMACDPARTPEVRGAARLYAEALVHNALVGRGAPDVFSAVLLRDAASWLENVTRTAWRHSPAEVRHLAPPDASP
ncbi:MAG TPA: hypothetical protein VD971_07955 [Phycisphaerales bacterium]|nr:hypothetical protein [Phycisphaerales bacterium]